MVQKLDWIPLSGFISSLFIIVSFLFYGTYSSKIKIGIKPNLKQAYKIENKRYFSTTRILNSPKGIDPYKYDKNSKFPDENNNNQNTEPFRVGTDFYVGLTAIVGLIAMGTVATRSELNVPAMATGLTGIGAAVMSTS